MKLSIARCDGLYVARRIGGSKGEMAFPPIKIRLDVIDEGEVRSVTCR